MDSQPQRGVRGVPGVPSRPNGNVPFERPPEAPHPFAEERWGAGSALVPPRRLAGFARVPMPAQRWEALTGSAANGTIRAGGKGSYLSEIKGTFLLCRHTMPHGRDKPWLAWSRAREPGASVGQRRCGILARNHKALQSGVTPTERWLSGRKQRFAKPSYGLNRYRGFESPPLRQLSKSGPLRPNPLEFLSLPEFESANSWNGSRSTIRNSPPFQDASFSTSVQQFALFRPAVRHKQVGRLTGQHHQVDGFAGGWKRSSPR